MKEASSLLQYTANLPLDDAAEQSASFQEFYTDCNDAFVEACKGRKKCGTREATMAAYDKSVRALCSLQTHVKSLSPEKYRAHRRTPVYPSLPLPDRAHIAASVAADPSVAKMSLVIPYTQTVPPRSLSPSVRHVMLVLYLCAMGYLGCIGLVFVFSPQIWIDSLVVLIGELIMVVPNYISSVCLQFLVSLQRHVSKHVLKVLRWFFGLPLQKPVVASLFLDSPPSDQSGVANFPPLASMCLFCTFALGYYLLSSKLWHLLMSRYE